MAGNASMRRKRSKKRSYKRAMQSSPDVVGPTPDVQKLMFILNLVFNRPDERRGLLMNRFIHPEAEMVSVGVLDDRLTFYDSDAEEHIELTAAQKKRPGFIGSTMTLYNQWMDKDENVTGETKKTFRNKKGFFTIAEVVEKICEFEITDRPKSKWFGGIDAHHVFYEGMSKGEKGYSIRYGS